MAERRSRSQSRSWTVLDFRAPGPFGSADEAPPAASGLPCGPDVLTGDEVAALLRVSKRTVERLQLPSVKLGKCRRYLREDVLTYLRGRVL